MGGYMSKELRCEPVFMVQHEQTTLFTAKQFNSCVDGSGCTTENSFIYPGEQCTDSVVVTDDVAVNSKLFTVVDDKLLSEPFVQLNSSTWNLFNLQYSTSKDKSCTHVQVSTVKREEVEDSPSSEVKNSHLMNERQDFEDDSTNEQISHKDSTSSESVYQLSSSKKHSLTQKHTESFKNQGNNEISMSQCEHKTECETTHLNRSLSISKTECELSFNSNTHVCDLCNRRCVSKSKLIVHKRTHTGEKPYRCSFCNKAFSRKGNLSRHKTTHTGDKPFVCSSCNKAFSEKGSLINHLRTHTGERPFVCSSCNKAFSQKGSLINHLRTHTGERPFVCSSCNKAFSQKGSLINHLRTHTGERPFVCSSCNKAFSEKGSLRIHLRTHTGEKPYRCSLCNKAFSHKGNLSRHKTIHSQ